MPHSARMVLALPLTFVKRCGLSSKRTLEAEQRMQTGFRAICQKKMLLHGVSDLSEA